MNTTFVPSRLAVGQWWQTVYGPADPKHASYLSQTAANQNTRRDEALVLTYESMNDSAFLFEAGFCVVHCVDASYNGGRSAQPLFKKFGGRFKLTQARFKEVHLGFGQYDLVVSDKALAYEDPESYEFVLERAKVSLRPRGVIALTLFGERDQWLPNHRDFPMNTKPEIRQLFEDFEIISIVEVENDAPFIDGTPKHWHYFRVLARKPDQSM
jgi:hypothetical protein